MCCKVVASFSCNLCQRQLTRLWLCQQAFQAISLPRIASFKVGAGISSVLLVPKQMRMLLTVTWQLEVSICEDKFQLNIHTPKFLYRKNRKCQMPFFFYLKANNLYISFKMSTSWNEIKIMHASIRSKCQFLKIVVPQVSFLPLFI